MKLLRFDILVESIYDSLSKDIPWSTDWQQAEFHDSFRPKSDFHYAMLILERIKTSPITDGDIHF